MLRNCAAQNDFDTASVIPYLTEARTVGHRRKLNAPNTKVWKNVLVDKEVKPGDKNRVRTMYSARW